jgi:hypothetical protein
MYTHEIVERHVNLAERLVSPLGPILRHSLNPQQTTADRSHVTRASGSCRGRGTIPPRSRHLPVAVTEGRQTETSTKPGAALDRHTAVFRLPG